MLLGSAPQHYILPMTMLLDDVPSQAVDLEDCVAAVFNVAGFHVEKGLVQRDPEDVLELDAVITEYSQHGLVRRLLEMKSGGWGYLDAFTVIGWMKYLGIEQGYLFALTEARNKTHTVVDARLAPHGLRVFGLRDDTPFYRQFELAGLVPEVESTAYEACRFSYAIERAFVKYAGAVAKSKPGSKGARAILDYYRLVNVGIFFSENEYGRLKALYAAFQDHPKLSLGVARELDGGDFDCTTGDPTNERLGEAIYDGKHDLVLAAMYVEQRARLAILKAACDILALDREPQTVLQLGKVVLSELDFLPASFRQGLDKLRSHPMAPHYALLHQLFVSVFGGFLLQDRRAEELSMLGRLARMSPGDAEQGLSAFDLLLPKGSSWMGSSYNSQCRFLHMVPMPLQGIGAYWRQLKRGVANYSELGYDDYTPRDLGKWHNCGYQFLKRRSDLRVVDEDQPPSAA